MRHSCVQLNQTVHFCLNEKCKQKSAFTCSNIKCKCNIMHKRCQTGKISTALEVIAQKLQETSEIRQFVDEAIQKEISRLSNLRDYLCKKIDQEMKFAKLSNIQTQFYKLFLNEENPQEFTGANLLQLWEILQSQANNQDNCKFDLIKKELDVYSKSIIKSTQIVIDEIEYINQGVKKVKKSSIIDDIQKSNKLMKFFPKKIKSMTSIFKASQHNFSIKQYFEQCGSQTNTIIVCQNISNKILGGYTPLQLRSQSDQTQDKHVSDSSNSSFLFSLQTNQKFALKRTHQAIYKWANQNYIDFGRNCFSICDNAHSTSSSGFHFGYSQYQSLDYKDIPQSYLKITGSQYYTFLIKEWQVIKVEFQQ